MTLRTTSKMRSKDDAIETAPEQVSQRKAADARYWLQVDRQTKRSFATLEEAETMGLGIKTAHPIVQVSVYDSVDCTNKMIEAAAAAEA